MKLTPWQGDKANATSRTEVSIASHHACGDFLDPEGIYTAFCTDKDGNLKWIDTIPNLVTTQGKNYLLDNGLAGSAFTAAYYMGLISSTSYSAIAAGDTAASHSGWLEAGGTNAPIYSQGARQTCAWSAASGGSKALSAALTFTIATTGGTLKGAAIWTVSTKDATTGTLLSAGLFTGGDKVVSVGDTVNVSYSLAL